MNKTILKYIVFNDCVIYPTATTERKSGGTKTTVSAIHKTQVASRDCFALKTKTKTGNSNISLHSIVQELVVLAKFSRLARRSTHLVKQCNRTASF